MSLSNCCFEEIIEDTDVCSKCKEHCGEVKMSLDEKIWHDGSFENQKGDKDLLKVEDVKQFIKERVCDATRLLGLFNDGNLTSIDLREHRQKIKDEAGEGLI